MKGRSFVYHLFFWAVLYALWVIVFRSYSISITRTMTIEFCYLIFITADYYIINNFILPVYLFKRKYTWFITVSILTIALSAWGRSLVAHNMNLYYFRNPGIIDFPTLYIHSLINISLWVLLVTIGKMIIERRQTHQQLELIEKERVKTELDYLKAQINPHSLFNSLNTIYGHIEKSNMVARNSLLQFSELLRYQLYECTDEKVSLEKEINYINEFISFHRLRKNDNLQINFKIEKIKPDLVIAPLLLVVPIENAFKFVSSFPDMENKICISLSTKGNILHGIFSNTKDPQESESVRKANGIGVANLKRRLELLYPGKFRYTIKNEINFYETSLTIDLS